MAEQSVISRMRARISQLETENHRLSAENAGLRELAGHLRTCLECGEMDVRHCEQGRQLWNTAFPNKQVTQDE
jgi:hypothetical protein